MWVVQKKIEYADYECASLFIINVALFIINVQIVAREYAWYYILSSRPGMPDLYWYAEYAYVGQNWMHTDFHDINECEYKPTRLRLGCTNNPSLTDLYLYANIAQIHGIKLIQKWWYANILKCS